VNVTLRPAAASDGAFVQSVYFTTQRWIIERLFGWRGDDFERDRFLRNRDHQDCLAIDGIYLLPAFQRRGIGSQLVSQTIADARRVGLPVRLSAARINPALRLYRRLGFDVVGESEFKVFMERRPA